MVGLASADKQREDEFVGMRRIPGRVDAELRPLRLKPQDLEDLISMFQKFQEQSETEKPMRLQTATHETDDPGDLYALHDRSLPVLKIRDGEYDIAVWLDCRNTVVYGNPHREPARAAAREIIEFLRPLQRNLASRYLPFVRLPVVAIGLCLVFAIGGLGAWALSGDLVSNPSLFLLFALVGSVVGYSGGTLSQRFPEPARAHPVILHPDSGRWHERNQVIFQLLLIAVTIVGTGAFAVLIDSLR